MPRKKAVAPSRVRTPQQAARDKMLIDAGYTKADVWRELQRRGETLSVASVRAALDNRYANAAVTAAFCALTGVRSDAAFPLDEPRYRTGAAVKRSTKRGRPARVDSDQRASYRGPRADAPDSIR